MTAALAPVNGTGTRSAAAEGVPVGAGGYFFCGLTNLQVDSLSGP